MQAMPGMMKNMGGQSGENKINEHMISTYAGVGSGIMTATVVLWIRFQLVLKNPKKAERNAAQQYRREKSGDWKEGIQICLHRTIMALYLICLIGGLWYPVLISVVGILMWIFLLTYVISYKVYERKM